MEINKISIDGKFWVQLQPHLLSFGWEGMPKDVHYTIAFNEHSPMINLHVTKNVTLENDERKPYIRIVQISKEDLTRVSDSITKRMMGLIMEPYDIVEFKRKHRSQVGFLSFSSLQEGEVSKVVEMKLVNAFKPITKRQGKRLKFQNKIAEQLESFATEKGLMKRMFREIRPLRAKPKSWIEAGMLIGKHECVTVIRIIDKWYKIREHNSIRGMIKHLTNDKIAEVLTKKTKYALAKIRHANTYQQVAHHDKPVTLFFKRSAETKKEVL